MATHLPRLRLTVRYRDAEGQGKTQVLFVNVPVTSTIAEVDAGIAAIVADLQAATQIHIYSYTWARSAIGTLTLPAYSGTTGSDDGAYLTLAAADGTSIHTTIAAPTVATFLTDGETVDPTGDAAGLIADYTTGTVVGGITFQLCTNVGTVASAYISGYYRRSKVQKVRRHGIATEIGGD